MAATAVDLRAHIALNRFGLGAKWGAIGRIRANAKAAVLAELNVANIALINPAGLPTYVKACQDVHTSFDREHANKELELTARLAKHMQPEIGFVERLVLFFSNHFSMSINKDGAVRSTIGQLERDVIRKNVLGSFGTMLLGVMSHPAMIRYLDNENSIGPNSPIGLSWGVGLNHNLAREICELHTLGVGGGYTEADVHALANGLSGWSFVNGWEADNNANGGNATNRGQYIFRADWHQPGTQTFQKKAYAQTGKAQAMAMLADLALHPSTAQFIAFKLVHHFISEQPTPAMVNPVKAAFINTRGNLKAVAQALVNLPEAWTAPLNKIRTPYELQVAEMRAMGRIYSLADRWAFSEPLSALRHAPWERPAPDGYSDDTAYWTGPDAMRVRLETAQLNAWALQKNTPYPRTALELATALFASNLTAPSRTAITGATGILDGLTTVFMLPEFQRR